MSSLADAIVVEDSSDDEGPKPPRAVPFCARPTAKAPPPKATAPQPPPWARALEAPPPPPSRAKAPPPPPWARALEAPPPPPSRAKAPPPKATAPPPPPPIPSLPTTARRAPVGDDDPCRKCKRKPSKTTFSYFSTGARKKTCDECLPPARKKLCGPDRQAVAVASVPSPPPVTSTTEHCTIPKCTDGSCRRLHQCGRMGYGCRSGRQWLASVAFKYKKGGLQRLLTCKECAAKKKEINAINNPIYNPINNPINNAKTSEKTMQNRIAYERETLGDEHDLSAAALQAHREAAIDYVTQLIADNWKMYPDGFAFQIYGASTGSKGFSVVEEGVNQFRKRASKPTIVDALGRVPDVALTRAWGPGGKSVYDCGSSKVISHAVEKALHTHFKPICDASDGKMPRLWRACGAGAPQGIGPYHVCIRIMPLPLPHGWRRGF